MPTSTHLDDLKINVLTESQFDAAVQGGVIGAGEISMITDLDEAVQVATMPTAAAGEEGKIYQFIGTTDANYTNGYFYKCVSDGQDPATYSWTQTDVQPAPSGLPDQTGNSGKFLTTDGTDASWSDKPLVNIATDSSGIIISDETQSSNGWRSVIVGKKCKLSDPGYASNVLLGYNIISSQSNNIYIGGTYDSTGKYLFGGNNIIISPYNVTTYSDTAIVIGRVQNSPSTRSICVGEIFGTAPKYGQVILGNGTMYNTADNEAGSLWFLSKPSGTIENHFKVISADGTIPTDRLTHAINKYSTMPTAASTNVGWIVQFTGTTDATYTHGYIYECKAQGTDPETYAWEAVEVQAGGGLPDQTGNSGKFLTTDGTDASWATINALQNTATGSSSLTVSGTATATAATTNLGVGSSCEAAGGVALGYESKIQNSSSNFSTAVGRSATVTNANCTAVGAYSGSSSNYIGSIVAVGYMARAEANGTVTIGTSSTCGASATRAVIVGTESSSNGTRGIAIGYKVTANAAGAIQIGSNGSSNAWHINSTPETLKVGNVNGNFEMMSADGTIPTDRFTTTPSSDGTYVPTLTISSGVATRTWGAAASAPVVPATMPTLAVADWYSNTQTVNVTGVTASNIVFVSPAPASAADYAAAGIVCTAQGSGTLTFTCTTVPTNAITVNVVILG